MSTAAELGIRDRARTDAELGRQPESQEARTHGLVARARRRPLAVVITVLSLLLLGAGIRFVGLDQPALDFHSTRQYNSALLARKYEQALGGAGAGVPRATVSAAAPAEIEPPIMEAVTAVAWRLSGSEPMWFPRALSILAWTLGGWLLYLLLERLASPFAGIAGVAVWSLLPFGIAATRTFQPDPLMVTALVGAVLALVVHDDEPSDRRLVVAGLAGGLALLVKLPAVFFVAPVFIVLTFHRGGMRAFRSRSAALYGALLIAPALVYNAYGFLIGGFLQGQQGGRVLPDLLITGGFWRDWSAMVVDIVGIVLPLAALAGVLVARNHARRVGAALVVGYITFGMVFTYHYTTHSYYHLPLVMVLSVGIGLLANALIVFVRARQADLLSVGVAAATAALVIAGSQSGSFPAFPAAIPATSANAEVAVPREIGSLLHHASGLVFLAPSYGNTLEFYGGVAGTWWPASGDVKLSQIEHTAQESVQQRLDTIRRTSGADFFVVTALHQWQAQPDLRAYLDSHYPRLASRPDYIIYDLRAPRR